MYRALEEQSVTSKLEGERDTERLPEPGWRAACSLVVTGRTWWDGHNLKEKYGNFFVCYTL